MNILTHVHGLARVELLVMGWRNLYRSLMVGGASQCTRARMEFMQSLPDVGDLVLIESVHPATPARERIGYLVKIEDVPWRAPSEDEPVPPTDRRWTITTLDDGAEVRWLNVSVVRCYHEPHGGAPQALHQGFEVAL